MQDLSRLLLEALAAQVSDRGNGGKGPDQTVLDDESESGQNGSTGSSYLPVLPPVASVCSLELGKDKLIVRNVYAYFGRTLLKGEDRQFDVPSPGNEKFLYARVKHPLSGTLELSIVANDSDSLASDLTVTYRLLYSVKLQNGSWTNSKTRVTVIDYRYIPEIPAYT